MASDTRLPNNLQTIENLLNNKTVPLTHIQYSWPDNMTASIDRTTHSTLTILLNARLNSELLWFQATGRYTPGSLRAWKKILRLVSDALPSATHGKLGR